MFVKIHKPLAVTGGDNKGSSSTLFEYLSKEDIGKNIIERSGFFTANDQRITEDAATKMIDGNNKNLGKNDYKFYMVSINPSSKEQKHLSGGKEVNEMNALEKEAFETKLRDYTHEVMQNYAASFNRDISSEDLVYVARIEHERTYKGTDKEVLSGEKKSGSQKEGMQSHIHVVVSRNNREQNMKLSPLSQHRPANENTLLNGKEVRQGFEHMQFKIESEKSFDRMFDYQRDKGEKIKQPANSQSKLNSLNPLSSSNEVEREINSPSGVTRFKDSVKNIENRHTDPFNHIMKQIENEKLKDIGKQL